MRLRPPLPLRLAVQDMVADRRLSLCQILALAAKVASARKCPKDHFARNLKTSQIL